MTAVVRAYFVGTYCFERYHSFLFPLRVISDCMVTDGYGGRVIIMMSQRFDRHLDFKPHLHIMVSAAGLKEGESRWITRLCILLMRSSIG